MKDPWTSLDGDVVDKEVNTAFKVMTKTGRVLQQRELTACADNCAAVKKDIEAFKPYIPLVQVRRSRTV